MMPRAAGCRRPWREVSREPAIAFAPAAQGERHDRSAGDGIDDLLVVRKASRGRSGSRSLVRTSVTA
jgi:hypothetical protein